MAAGKWHLMAQQEGSEEKDISVHANYQNQTKYCIVSTKMAYAQHIQ